MKKEDIVKRINDVIDRSNKNKDVTYPSITIPDDEYQVLKTKGECAKLKIIRTRRGMVWRRFDRTKYESEHENQYL